MKKFGMYFVLLILFLLVSACSLDDILFEGDSNDNPQTLEELSEVEDFKPGAIAHIIEGELNRKGQAVGFHYEGFPSGKGEVVDGTETEVDEHGVYEAKVIVEGVAKQSNGGRSSFFPEDWTAQDVIDAINEAYGEREWLTGNTYAGMTEEGIVVHMYLDNQDKIISAFPVY